MKVDFVGRCLIGMCKMQEFAEKEIEIGNLHLLWFRSTKVMTAGIYSQSR